MTYIVVKFEDFEGRSYVNDSKMVSIFTGSVKTTIF